MKRLLLPVCAALALVLPACRPKPLPEPPATVVRVEPAQRLQDVSLQGSQTYIGMIRGENETDLSFKVGGKLDLIGPAPGKNWGEGDVIEQDQVLAQLQQVDFKAELDSAAARAELAQSRFARAELLRRDQAVSAQEFDVTRSAHDEARAALDHARQAFLDSTLRAPFNGQVLARVANAGENVQAGRPVLRVADLSTVSVDLGVPDRIVNHIKRGQLIPVAVNSLEGRRFEGEVAEVGVAAKEGSRLFKVVLKVRNPRGELRSGMTASVTFQEPTRNLAGAVLVRMSALVASAPGAGGTNSGPPLAVFVVDESGRAQERPVKTDDIIRSSVVVTSGLAPGARVVVVGASRLHDGERVDARPFAPASGR